MLDFCREVRENTIKQDGKRQAKFIYKGAKMATATQNPETQAPVEAEVVTMTYAKAPITIEGAGFKLHKKKAIALPILRIVNERSYYLRIDEAMFVGKQIESDKKKGKGPATIMTVTNLETMEQAQIVVPVVLEGTLEEAFPEQSYVGRLFEIVKHNKVGDQAYHTFTVVEIEIEAE